VAFSLPRCQGKIYVAAWDSDSGGRTGQSFQRQLGALTVLLCRSSYPGNKRCGSTMARVFVLTPLRSTMALHAKHHRLHEDWSVTRQERSEGLKGATLSSHAHVTGQWHDLCGLSPDGPLFHQSDLLICLAVPITRWMHISRRSGACSRI
jgi:hypothetical protein